MEEKRVSPLKEIRLKCLDCSCGSSNEVKLCVRPRNAHCIRSGRGITRLLRSGNTQRNRKRR